MYDEYIEVSTNLKTRPSKDKVMEIMKDLDIAEEKVIEYYFVRSHKVNFQFV